MLTRHHDETQLRPLLLNATNAVQTQARFRGSSLNSLLVGHQELIERYGTVVLVPAPAASHGRSGCVGNIGALVFRVAEAALRPPPPADLWYGSNSAMARRAVASPSALASSSSSSSSCWGAPDMGLRDRPGEPCDKTPGYARIRSFSLWILGARKRGDGPEPGWGGAARLCGVFTHYPAYPEQSNDRDHGKRYRNAFPGPFLCFLRTIPFFSPASHALPTLLPARSPVLSTPRAPFPLHTTALRAR